MSKYKYTRQLSSQYRKVFKSYHSVDRYESSYKQTTTQRQFINNSLIDSAAFTRNIHPNHNHYRVQTEALNRSEDVAQRVNSQQIINKNKLGTLKSPLLKISKCKTQKSQNYNQNQITKPCYLNDSNNQNMLDKKNHLDMIKRNYLQQDQIYLEKPYNNTKNNICLKMGQIHKKRNELKQIKLRVNDLKKINKRCSYLNNQNQIQMQENNDQYQDKDKLPNNQPSNPWNQDQQNKIVNSPWKNTAILTLDKLSIDKQRKPFTNINFNVESKENQSQLKSKITQKYYNKNYLIDKKIKTLNKQDQGIQTPHFCQNQTQNQFLPTNQPLTIYNKNSNQFVGYDKNKLTPKNSNKTKVNYENKYVRRYPQQDELNKIVVENNQMMSYNKDVESRKDHYLNNNIYNRETIGHIMKDSICNKQGISNKKLQNIARNTFSDRF